MSIRQHLEWDGNVLHGYVNFGTELNDDRNELAKEAFVLLIVCINGTWKLPVGYFLTNGLNGLTKAFNCTAMYYLSRKYWSTSCFSYLWWSSLKYKFGKFIGMFLSIPQYSNLVWW